jgi:ATP-dependent helicase/nuclease subunit B
LTPGKVKTRILQRNAERSRFSKSASLGHLERCWNSPLAYEGEVDIHLIECADPRAETIFCAREINRHARAGGRYREVAVIARNFENDYPHLLRQTFRKYEIPYFLDHRENVAHHPLAELTRGALRTVANHWKRRDWISALKSGLIHSDTDLLDKLENEALARGWEGEVWLKGFTIHKKPELEKEMNQLRAKLVKPMTRFQEALGSRPNGPELASALEALWLELEVEKQLENWRDSPGDTVHQTVWTQAQEWVENLRLAFPRQRWSIREWVPIVEAGLDGLSVGVIPPALDQVLVGRVDRSRNPDLKKLFVLGFNEGIFPAPPGEHSLLSEHDRDALRELGRELSNTPALRIGEEQFFGYIACSRAREKLCISWSKAGADGKAINPSRFVSHIKRIFPSLNAEFWNAPGFLAEVEHLCELGALRDGELAPEPDMKERLEKKLALNLYGRELEVSISSMEKFAMCPFRFFLEKGLGLEERVEFELDAREQGSFQHEVLSRFHENLKKEGKLWRDIDADEAVARIKRIAEEVMESFRDGLLEATESNRFTAECYNKALQEFIRVVIGWFQSNDFNPEFVELPFGKDKKLPGWRIPLREGRALLIKGRIDRVDLHRQGDTAHCVIFDYKSGLKKPDPLLLSKGIQGQMTGYLAALMSIPEVKQEFGARELLPAGCFLIPLRPSFGRAANRKEAFEDEGERARGYTHRGIFDWSCLQLFDSKNPAGSGQFSYSVNKNGAPNKRTFSGLESGEFQAILGQTEELMREFGEEIYAGEMGIYPFRKGGQTACDTCHFPSICRFDPWKQIFIVLKKPEKSKMAK